MAGEQDDAGQGEQEPGQDVDRVVVEVVGGLVEEEAGGPGGHHRGQGQAGALAPGQRADPSVGVEPTQPELLRGHLGAPIGVPGVVVDGVIEGGGVRRAAGLVVQVAGELLDALHRLAQRPQGRGQHLADRAVVTERRLLAEQHQVGRPRRRLDDTGDRAGRGQPPGDRTEQRGLARTVLADQPDPAPRLGDQVDPVQHGAVAEADGEVADDDGLQGSHWGVLTVVRDSPGPRWGAGRGRESGQAEIHMMHPG